MSKPTPPVGFLGLPDLNDVINQATKLLPPQVTEAIKDVTGIILDPNDDSIKEGDPQPEGQKPIPVDAGSKELNAAVKAIDAVTTALDLVLKFAFLIPDQYEGPIKALKGALATIRSWLD